MKKLLPVLAFSAIAFVGLWTVANAVSISGSALEVDGSGNLYAPGNFNASGTITVGGVAVSTSTGGGSPVNINGAGASSTYTLNVTSTTSTVPSASTSTASVTFAIPNTQHVQSWTVGPTGSTGVDFTSIQNALNACGTAGGGTIYLLGGTYAQAGTGLQWKGSNCILTGDYGSSTITFTGATTLFSTASSGAQYSHNEIHNFTITGDGNASGVAIAESNMSHGNYSNLTIDDVGTCFQMHDTADITFYNDTENIDCTTVVKYGIDGSSTEPWNGNLFQNIFIGCSSNNCISVYDGNSEHNTFENIYEEPAGAPLTGSIGVDIFDSNTGSNPGNFGNIFINNYIEGNATAIKVAAGTSCGSGECIAGDMFIGGISDTNGTLTLVATSGVAFFDFNNNFAPETVLTSHVSFVGQTVATALGTCSHGTIGTNSNDQAGSVTFSAAGTTSCAVNFGTSWNSAPLCQAEVASGTPAALTCQTTTSKLTITSAASIPTSTILSYFVIGTAPQ